MPVYSQVRGFRDVGLPVLILGESGQTGKDLVRCCWRQDLELQHLVREKKVRAGCGSVLQDFPEVEEPSIWTSFQAKIAKRQK